MAQPDKTQELDSEDTQQQDNLLELSSSGNDRLTLDINQQISILEDSIDTLNKKLNSTNRKVNKEVKRLNESDDEITDKVADTYKQLGIIEKTFDDLGQQSTKINTDLKKVNTSLKKLEKTSAEALATAVDKQQEINLSFKDNHEQLIEKAEKLSKKATSISSKLNKSIRDNSKALTELESRIVVELENIAATSLKRDTALDQRVDDSNQQLASQNAKMLLMQSVDEALEKRASALEATSQTLVQDSENLKDSTETLSILTSKLSADVEALEIHSASLQQQNDQQQGLIETLQVKTESIARTLTSLVDLEKRHFKTLGSISIVLLLAIVSLFFYGEYMRDTEASVEAQRNVQVNNQVAELQNGVEDEQLASQVFNTEILALQKNVQTMQQEIQGMNDQLDSVDGRIRYMAPLYNFGSDNTIHGSQWLSQLNPQQQSIKVASVSDKQELYEIAQRYNHYFSQDLAYFEQDGNFTLIYGGKFDGDAAIQQQLRDMPRSMNFHDLSAIANADILASIQQ